MDRETFRQRLTGIVVPMATPFRDDYSLDVSAVSKTLPFLIERGVSAVMVCGSTGEFASLSLDERKQMVQAAVQVADHRVLVLAGVSDTYYRNVIDLAQFSQRAGADALILVAPYYFYPSEDEVFRYFELLDREIDIPFMFYNNPATAKINASLQLIERLGELKHFAGLKDTNSQPIRYLEFLKRFGARFAMIPAGEPAAIFNIVSGAPGFMTVAANFLPELLVSIFKAAQARDLDRAFALFDKLATYRQLFEARVAAGYPGYVVYAKAGMNLRGLPAGPVRPPLTYPSPAELDKLREIMRTVLEIPVAG